MSLILAIVPVAILLALAVLAVLYVLRSRRSATQVQVAVAANQAISSRITAALAEERIDSRVVEDAGVLSVTVDQELEERARQVLRSHIA